MTEEERMALDIMQGRYAGNIAAQLTEEVREKLADVARRSAALNCEWVAIADAEARRLAKSEEEYSTLFAEIASYLSRLSNAEALAQAPEHFPSNNLSM